MLKGRNFLLKRKIGEFTDKANSRFTLILRERLAEVFGKLDGKRLCGEAGAIYTAKNARFPSKPFSS